MDGIGKVAITTAGVSGLVGVGFLVWSMVRTTPADILSTGLTGFFLILVAGLLASVAHT